MYIYIVGGLMIFATYMMWDSNYQSQQNQEDQVQQNNATTKANLPENGNQKKKPLELFECKTAEEEKMSLTAIRENASQISFIAYDSKEKIISLVEDDWMKKIHTIEIYVDGKTIRHKVIEPSNLLEVMGE